jgi:DNA-binding LytR/AlgR family response regulator
MVSCIIIDDQEEAIEVLESHLKSKSEFELMNSFTDPLAALKYLEKNNIDLVFLDIQMPKLTGIEFLETLKAKNLKHLPQFIFVTGYSEYAVDGFEQGISDFLLKPVTFKRFNIAMDRFLQNFRNSNEESKLSLDYFFADNEGLKVKIRFSEIVYVESAGNYISIFKTNERLTILQSLTGLETMLDKQSFIRTHKSYIVNINCIESARGTELFVKYQSNLKSVPISVTYKEKVFKRLGIN